MKNVNDLKEAIREIANQIVLEMRSKGSADISFKDIVRIVKNENRNHVFDGVPFYGLIQTYQEIMKNEIRQEDFFDYHFAEPYIFKGIRIYLDERINSNKGPLSRERVLKKRETPLLTVEALVYKQNNNKKSFKTY